MRTVLTATMLAPGPPRTRAAARQPTVHCRLLPATTRTGAKCSRRGDERATVKPRGQPVPAPLPRSSPRCSLRSRPPRIDVGGVRRAREDPWSTDGAPLRRAGIPVYGISGVWFDVDDVRAHGQDERIAVAAFEQGLEFMYRLMKRLGGAR